MNLEELLPESHIIVGVESGTTESIIKQLAAPLVADGILVDEALFVEAVIDRETKFSTQVDEYVAFPHAHSDGVSRLGLTLGLALGDGIKLADNTPGQCKIFFLIAVPSNAPEAHLELLALLVNFMMTGKNKANLLKAKTVKGALRVIKNWK